MADSVFHVDPVKKEELRRSKPWLTVPTYFRRVKITAVAAMKMTSHAATGVETGLRSANAMPVEVMGLLHGHASTQEPFTFIVTDAFPLPIEGTETTVMADNPEVMSYMISLADSLETTRTENFMGWYHSHPFDVGPHSNAFLSATDVGTQFGWQIAEDQAGNPWLSLVVDPLRGLAKGKPEIGAFRCYPTSYTPPRGLAPDGVQWEDDKARNARWGESCMSYYQLEVEYIVPALTSSLLSILARDFMWTRVLSATPALEKEARDRLPDRLKAVSAHVGSATAALTAAAATAATEHSSGGGLSLLGGPGGFGSSMRTDAGGGMGGLLSSILMGGGGGGGGGGDGGYDDYAGAIGGAGGGVDFSRWGGGRGGRGGGGRNGGPIGVDAGAAASIAAAASASAELAVELCKGQAAQAIKDAVFNLRRHRCGCAHEAAAVAAAGTGAAAGGGDGGGDSAVAAAVPVAAAAVPVAAAVPLAAAGEAEDAGARIMAVSHEVAATA